MSKSASIPSDSKALFWKTVLNQLHRDEISHFDHRVVEELCSCSGKWIDMIPRGLVYSYSYLYHCVKGLGCEDGEAIEKDVLRTVGAVKDGPKVFGDTSELGKAGMARAMHRLLTAISITDSMGYCQGMNYVADFLLKLTSEEESFCLFLFALRNRHLCCLYETKLPVLSDFMEVFSLQLTYRLPLLASTLKERGFIAPFYSIEWFTTLFTLACPFGLTIMIFDLFFAGLQDVQIRCAIAIMEILEPQLLLMSVEELLKEFRHMCQGVDTEDVIIRALRIQLVPVKLLPSQSTPSAISRAHFLLDCKYSEDRDSETLLSLRLRYINEAIAAMQDRDADCGRWVKDRSSRHLASSPRSQPTSPSSATGNEPDPIVIEVLGSIVDVLCSNEESDPDRASMYVSSSSSRYRDTMIESDPAMYQEYFHVLTDPDLMEHAYELKEILVMCDRIAQWVQLNQKWVDCLSCMKSELAKYNMADHLLRYAIANNSHTRTILFLLSVAGADPNSQDRFLRTPLHFAASYNRPDVVRLLLLAGADATVKGSLRPPRLDHVPTTLTSAAQLIAQSGSASLTILRGKSCIACNILFHGSEVKRTTCKSCDVILCEHCLDTHYCVWQHGSVAGARDKEISPMNSPSRNRFRSSSLSRNSEDAAPELHLPASASTVTADKVKKVSCSSTTPSSSGHHVGVLLTSLESSLVDDDVDDDVGSDGISGHCNTEPVEPLPGMGDGPSLGCEGCAGDEEGGDDDVSADSGFGSVGEEGTNAYSISISERTASVEVTDCNKISAAELARADSNHDSRKHSSTGLISWIKSKGRTQSADVSAADESESATESPRYRSETGDFYSPTKPTKMSRKKRLSVALGNSFKRLKGISKKRSGSFGMSSSSRRRGNSLGVEEGGDSDVPLYWVGYRDDASYLVRLQPWQALLLPLALGAEDNRSTMLMEDVRMKRHSACTLSAVIAEVDDIEPFRTVSVVTDCDVCERRGDECKCTTRLPFSRKSPENLLNTESRHLFFRQEMAFFYALLKRDADMLSLDLDSKDFEVTEVHSPPVPDLGERHNAVGSSDVDKSLIDHLSASNIADVFDDTYIPAIEIPCDAEISSRSLSADSRPRDSSITMTSRNTADARVHRSLATAEDLRKAIVRQFVSGDWTIGEDDEFWVSDESVWHCRQCAIPFSLFQRKHHCRRCGGVFCADDAPHVDMFECLPESFQETLRKLLIIDSSIEKKQFRLCVSCKTDMRHCSGLLLEVDMTLPKYTLAFWLSTISSKNPRNTYLNSEDQYSSDFKDMRLGRGFPVAGQWVDSMAEWLWRDSKTASET